MSGYETSTASAGEWSWPAKSRHRAVIQADQNTVFDIALTVGTQSEYFDYRSYALARYPIGRAIQTWSAHGKSRGPTAIGRWLAPIQSLQLSSNENGFSYFRTARIRPVPWRDVLEPAFREALALVGFGFHHKAGAAEVGLAVN